MDTAPVARDIVEIFERHGEWREQEASRLLSQSASLSDVEHKAIIERTSYKPGKEMVQYWGFVSLRYSSTLPHIQLTSA
jgi:hypothetical protein